MAWIRPKSTRLKNSIEKTHPRSHSRAGLPNAPADGHNRLDERIDHPQSPRYFSVPSLMRLLNSTAHNLSDPTAASDAGYSRYTEPFASRYLSDWLMGATLRLWSVKKGLTTATRGKVAP